MWIGLLLFVCGVVVGGAGWGVYALVTYQSDAEREQIQRSKENAARDRAIEDAERSKEFWDKLKEPFD